MLKPANGGCSAFHRVSVLQNVRKRQPKAARRWLLLHGEDDACVPLRSSEMLHAALTAANVPSELRALTSFGHGDFILKISLDCDACQVFRALDGFCV